MPPVRVDLRHRLDAAERMDDPQADPARLRRTVGDFALLNRLFSSFMPLFRRHLLPTLLSDPDRVWTVLDVGSGGADLDRALVRLARRRGLRLRITALDADPRMTPWARELCADYPEITPVTGSVFDLDQLGDFDLIVSNHTLHHLTYPQVRRAVDLCRRHARHGLLLNDLRRSWWAYLGYTFFTGLFLRRSFVFTDGRLSIRRGFTVAELERELAGLEAPVRIGRAAPARIYLY